MLPDLASTKTLPSVVHVSYQLNSHGLEVHPVDTGNSIVPIKVPNYPSHQEHQLVYLNTTMVVRQTIINIKCHHFQLSPLEVISNCMFLIIHEGTDET